MHRVVALLVVMLAAVVVTGFVRAEDEVRTPKLTLLNGALDGVSLVAGPESSLIIQNSTGGEVMRLGGHPGRRVGEEGSGAGRP